MSALLILVAATVVLVLHYRSRDPHTAARPPFSLDTRQVKPEIERRAQQFLAALRAGDEARLRAMALTSSDRGNVTGFVTAFGRRDDRRAGLQTSDLGERTGELDIAVPCKDGSTQHAIVLFAWKRTSFVSSGWYAIVDPPGPEFAMPDGCPAP